MLYLYREFQCFVLQTERCKLYCLTSDIRTRLSKRTDEILCLLNSFKGNEILSNSHYDSKKLFAVTAQEILSKVLQLVTSSL
jgi:hypothetical protein